MPSLEKIVKKLPDIVLKGVIKTAFYILFIAVVVNYILAPFLPGLVVVIPLTTVIGTYFSLLVAVILGDIVIYSLGGD